MSFWNPLIGGKIVSSVLNLDFNAPQTGQTNINLATYVSANNPTGNPNDIYDEIKLTIPSDYIIGSPSSATAAITVGSWQSHQDIVLINNGYIVGRGGSSGSGAGGTAINVDTTTMNSFTIENNSGGIIGGGGGGGDIGGTTPGSLYVPGVPLGGSPPFCDPSPAAGGAGGGGAGYLVGSPNATLTPAAVASTPSPAFPISPVSFNVGAGVVGETKAGCEYIPDNDDGEDAVPAPPYTGGTGVAGGPLGTGAPGRGAAGAYLTGPGVPKTTIINNGNLYGPSPYGNEPGQ